MAQASPQQHTWAVVSQEEEPTLTDDGEPTSVHHVTFQTNTGHKSTVSIPNERFTAANVARAITAKATQIAAVHGLNSTNAPTE